MTPHEKVWPFHGGPRAWLVVPSSPTWSGTCGQVSPLQATLCPFPDSCVRESSESGPPHSRRGRLCPPSRGGVFTPSGILL